MVAELKLTAEQRERIRTIEEDALFGWMRGSQSGSGEQSPNERILAVLSDDQVRQWRAMTGKPLKAAIAPFAPPSGAKATAC